MTLAGEVYFFMKKSTLNLDFTGYRWQKT